MTIDSTENGAPIPLPDSIYAAFKAEGYDPMTVIMIGNGGEPKTFVISEAFDSVSSDEGNVENLEAPHMTMQQTDQATQQSDLVKFGYRRCRICIFGVCFYVPC